jgi:RimJ/RimL family protein N-acetyltransferase
MAEARLKGYRKLRITTSASNHAMRALAGKFGARLEIRQGEYIGVLDLARSLQRELAERAALPLAA